MEEGGRAGEGGSGGERWGKVGEGGGWEKGKRGIGWRDKGGSGGGRGGGGWGGGREGGGPVRGGLEKTLWGMPRMGGGRRGEEGRGVG